MLSIPHDLCASASHDAYPVEEGCVVTYRAERGTESTQYLVTQPTLVFVVAGTKELRPHAAEDAQFVTAGQVVVIRSGAHVMAEFVAGAEGYRSTVVSFDRRFLRRLIGGGGDGGANDVGMAVVDAPAAPLQVLLHRLPDALAAESCVENRSWAVREVLISALKQAPLRSLLRQEVADWGHSENERLRSVMELHYLSPLTVPEYAGLCAMSLSSFKRNFRKLYGGAPGQWLSQARLNHAKRLLLGNTPSVTEICYRCGYNDLSNFIRAFRRFHGAPPTAFRKRSA